MVSKTYMNDGLEGRPTTIATTISWFVDPANETMQGNQDYMSRYAPFNSLFARNEDSNEIHLYLNSSPMRKIVLPQGATVTKLNEPFSHIRVYNAGAGTVAQGKLTIMFEKIQEKK